MITLQVNGQAKQIDADPATPLLYVLRHNLALRGPRFGCGLGQCGACTVHIDGSAVRSCVTPLSSVGAGHDLRRDRRAGCLESPVLG